MQTQQHWAQYHLHLFTKSIEKILLQYTADRAGLQSRGGAEEGRGGGGTDLGSSVAG